MLLLDFKYAYPINLYHFTPLKSKDIHLQLKFGMFNPDYEVVWEGLPN